MEYKKDYRKLKRVVNSLKEKYDFKGLYHFTDFTNLKHILDKGFLYSRNDCINNCIEFSDGANHEVLDRDINDVHNKVRFYYRAKTPTLYNNEGVKLESYCNTIHIPMPVYLLFDEEIIYLDCTEFSNGNATTSDIGNTADFFSNMDWKNIFHSTCFVSYERNYIVNKRQAELLSNKPISIEKYLKKIIFRCEADKKRAINIYGNSDLYCIDIDLFSNKNFDEPKDDKYKNNFIKDYEISYYTDEFNNETKLILTCEFQKVIDRYNINVGLEFNTEKNEDSYINIDNVVYFDKNNNIISKRDLAVKIKVEIIGNIEYINKLNVYINNCLYIEQYLESVMKI